MLAECEGGDPRGGGRSVPQLLRQLFARLGVGAWCRMLPMRGRTGALGLGAVLVLVGCPLSPPQWPKGKNLLLSEGQLARIRCVAAGPSSILLGDGAGHISSWSSSSLRW